MASSASWSGSVIVVAGVTNADIAPVLATVNNALNARVPTTVAFVMRDHYRKWLIDLWKDDPHMKLSTTSNGAISITVVQNCLASKVNSLPSPAEIFSLSNRCLPRPPWNVALHWYDPTIPPSKDGTFFGNFAEDKMQRLAYRNLDKYDRIAGILGVLPASLMDILRPDKYTSDCAHKVYGRRTKALCQSLRLTLLDGAHEVYGNWLRMQFSLDLEPQDDPILGSSLPSYHERTTGHWWTDSIQRLIDRGIHHLS
jgi:hypothetical protein